MKFEAALIKFSGGNFADSPGQWLLGSFLQYHIYSTQNMPAHMLVQLILRGSTRIPCCKVGMHRRRPATQTYFGHSQHVEVNALYRQLLPQDALAGTLPGLLSGNAQPHQTEYCEPFSI